jgi:rhamnosyltransferase
MKEFNKICSIVVLYQPQDIYNLKQISIECSSCIIVDNSECSNINLVNDLNLSNIFYIPIKDNVGIATAQNIGIKKARELGYDLVVFFDQDSVIYDGFIEKLVCSYNKLINEGFDVGLIGPRAHNFKTGYKYEPRNIFSKESKKERFTFATDTLSSGSLIPMSILDVVGDMKDDFFIDSVDHEWCWRAKYKFGKEIVIDEETLLPHMIGDGEIKFLGITFNMGSSFRYYYVYRNWILLMNLDYVPTKIKLRTLFLIPLRLLVYFIISKDRFYLTKMSLKGIYHGIIQKTGRLS